MDRIAQRLRYPCRIIFSIGLVLPVFAQSSETLPEAPTGERTEQTAPQREPQAEEDPPGQQRAQQVNSNTQGTNDPYETAEISREREAQADEDPLEQQEAEVTSEELFLRKPSLDLYGSIRLRYRETDNDSFWGDGGSRIGINGQLPLLSDKWLFGRVEYGINLLDELDFIIDRGSSSYAGEFGETLFPRLIYAGIESPDFILVAGKNWSTYYRVTSFTDRFQGAGGSASGTYNAGTDGGFTGTGRADRVLQTRIQIGSLRKNPYFKPGKLNIQIQNGEAIPATEGFNYGTTIGLSVLFETETNLSAGLAYNHATIDKNDLDDLKSSGIDGNATALALGLRWFSDNWYAGTVLARLENHETTDQLVYFDGTGLELYSQYQFLPRWWATAGFNYLTPDSDQTQAGEYEIKYGILGIRYSFDEFRQMIFANVRLDNGSTAEGDSIGDIYTVGVRWDLP